MKRTFAALLICCFMIQFCPIISLGVGSDNTKQGEILAPEPSTPSTDTSSLKENLFSCDCDLSDIPVFTVELKEDGLYGTLCHLPEGVTSIKAQHYFTSDAVNNGDDRVEGYSCEWSLTPQEDNSVPLTQLCASTGDLAMDAFLHKRVNNLYINLKMVCNGKAIYSNSGHFSNDLEGKAPETAPAFSAEIDLTSTGYQLMGSVTELLPTTARVRPYYSLDDDNYEAIVGNNPIDWNLNRLGVLNESELRKLNTQKCCFINMEPLKSYMNGDLKEFYLKLEITLDNGITYFTEAAHINSEEEKELPPHSTVLVRYAPTMEVSSMHAQYQMTVRADMTSEDIYAFLPDSVPVEVQITFADAKVPETGIVELPVVWKPLGELNLVAEERIKLEDATEPMVVLAGTQVRTPTGVYSLPEDIALEVTEGNTWDLYSDDIKLVLNVVEPNAAPVGQLDEDWDPMQQQKELMLSLDWKPTGATSMKVYSYVEGDKAWAELCDVLDRQAVNANQKVREYNSVTITNENESVYKRYLGDEIDGFFIGLEIEGGVYDGQKIHLPWPEEYTPHGEIPNIGGSGGNEGNVGTPDDGDSNAGGQRPTLPPTPKPKPEPPKTVGDSTTVTVQINPSTMDGVSKATISESLMNDTVKSAITAAHKANTDPVVHIELNTPRSATGMTVSLPYDAVEILSDVGNGKLTLTSDVGMLSLDNHALADILGKGIGDITLSMEKVNHDDLSSSQQKVINNRPTYDLSVLRGATAVSNFGDGTVTITLPYTLKADESPKAMMVFFVDSTGNLQEMETVYDEDTKEITFNTDHFSVYMIGYDELKLWENPYADVRSSQWFYEGVAFANHNGLMLGTSKTMFSPYTQTTRSMLTTVLARQAGVHTTSGEHWYSVGMYWAKSRSISDGSNPTGVLTREQMMTMLWRATGSPISTQSLWEFTDKDEIADFAKIAMAWGYEQGIIEGTSKKTLSPKKTVSRGELSTILMRYMQ